MPPVFDPTKPYRCSPRVALREESFGALAYDFGTRRLSFLKSRDLAELVADLELYPDIGRALDGHRLPAARRPALMAALAGLAETGTIEQRETENPVRRDERDSEADQGDPS